MDLYLFQQINQFALKWLWLDTLGIFFAEYFGYVLVTGLLLIAFYKAFVGKDFKKYWRAVVVSLLSAVLARAAIIGIRFFWQRPRPFVENNVNLLLEHNGFSFPSGHATFFFALSTVVFLYNKKIGALFLLGSFLISLARVFAGIHWPSDILAGAIIGILFGWFICKFCAEGGT